MKIGKAMYRVKDLDLGVHKLARKVIARIINLRNIKPKKINKMKSKRKK